MHWEQAVMKVRRGEGPWRLIRVLWRALLEFRLPNIRPLWGMLWVERGLRQRFLPLLLKIFYREPLMRYRCEHVGRRLDLSGPIPLIIGDGRIRIGEGVNVSGSNTWVVGSKVSSDALLEIGDRVTIGYQTNISVAKRVTIGADTMMASRVAIFDNPSHPMSPARRLRHESFSLADASPVTIGRNVWIGMGSMIMRGVTIGDNSIVAAGSIVTRDVPPNTIVAGNPAVVKRALSDDEDCRLATVLVASS